jgi:hypothetical protein
MCAHLGEQCCPYGLDIFDLGGLDEGLELVGLGELALIAQWRRGGPYGNVDTVIREDEGGVGGGKFGVGHFDVWVSREGVVRLCAESRCCRKDLPLAGVWEGRCTGRC